MPSHYDVLNSPCDVALRFIEVGYNCGNHPLDHRLQDTDGSHGCVLRAREIRIQSDAVGCAEPLVFRIEGFGAGCLAVRQSLCEFLVCNFGCVSFNFICSNSFAIDFVLASDASRDSVVRIALSMVVACALGLWNLGKDVAIEMHRTMLTLLRRRAVALAFHSRQLPSSVRERRGAREQSLYTGTPLPARASSESRKR